MHRTTIVLRSLGVLLWVAAGLKGYGLAVEPVSAQGPFAAAWVQATLIWLELLLGLWLLFGVAVAWAWLTAVATFLCFGAISLYQTWIGQASCGCFGKLSVNPWYTLGLDVVALLGLALCRPPISSSMSGVRAVLAARMAGVVATCGAILALLVILLGLGSWWFGSPQAALAHLRGEHVSVTPGLVNVGQGSPGEVCRATVEVSNWTDAPVRLIGGISDCSCVLTDDLPLTIPPGEVRSVTVQVKLPASTGAFSKTAAFLVGDQQLGVVPFRVTGRILRVSEGPDARGGE